MNRRVHEEKCDYCGKLEHYAKGLCENCYKRKQRKGFVEYYVHPTTSWYERNKEKARKKAKEYNKTHSEERKKSWRKYYLKNKEKESQRKKQWYLKNRERILNKIREKNESK